MSAGSYERDPWMPHRYPGSARLFQSISQSYATHHSDTRPRRRRVAQHEPSTGLRTAINQILWPRSSAVPFAYCPLHDTLCSAPNLRIVYSGRRQTSSARSRASTGRRWGRGPPCAMLETLSIGEKCIYSRRSIGSFPSVAGRGVDLGSAPPGSIPIHPTDSRTAMIVNCTSGVCLGGSTAHCFVARFLLLGALGYEFQCLSFGTCARRCESLRCTEPPPDI
ncbi:hypothetical protein DFH09DRAFT_1097692 [Mycena vulgaris]|nr:hypothetical protein DFH09DRAFT_1097692 [Mycena vulgaris]